MGAHGKGELSSCATLTGKQEISDDEINQQSAQAYKEVKAKSKMSTNQEWTAMVKRVADRIARSSDENFDWEVVLIDNKERVMS